MHCGLCKEGHPPLNPMLTAHVSMEVSCLKDSDSENLRLSQDCQVNQQKGQDSNSHFFNPRLRLFRRESVMEGGKLWSQTQTDLDFNPNSPSYHTGGLGRVMRVLQVLVFSL